ncbi:MAG TPA: caspase family protein, partial [Candidatus Melainabacteria bacterium]|nr:caspase family protein [Candidatus Melainabacteria bacterium]
MIRGILRFGVVAAGEIVRTGIENKALALLATVLLTIQFLAQAVWAQPGTSQNVLDDRPVADKWALVIGIDRFQDKRIPTLRYSAKDARDFADFLVKKGNFASDHILPLLNEQATFQNIEESLGDTWLPRRALSDDLVLIYVSTHGSPRELDVGKDNWLIAHNTNVDKLYSTGIELTSLAATVKKRTGCDRV